LSFNDNTRGKEEKEFYTVSNNTVSFLDKLLTIPVAIYFWWYGCRQKAGTHSKKQVD